MEQHSDHAESFSKWTQPGPLHGNYKILAEIAHSKLDFHLNKKIKMSTAVMKILDINWGLHPADYHISLPASRLWIAGRLSAEITYTKKHDGKLRLQTIFFPWKTTAAIHFVSPPVIPRSNDKKQYEFNNTHQHLDEETSMHYEQMLYFNEMPHLEIISAKLATLQSVRKTAEAKNMILDVNCELEYRILQNQVIRHES